MALTPFTGTVTAATLNANFDDATTAISSQATDGQVDFDVYHRALAFSGTGTAVADFLDFTLDDDCELRCLRITVQDGTAGRTVSVTLTQTEGDTAFLIDNTISASTTTIVGTTDSTEDYRTTTGAIRVRLLRGVSYRLTLATSAGAVTRLQGTAMLRTIRRSS